MRSAGRTAIECTATTLIVLLLSGTTALATPAADPPLPVIHSISPKEVIEKPVPQPAFTVHGENLRQPGVFGAGGNPVITIEHTALEGVSFSAIASTNFLGTEATIPSGVNHFNMLQMPLGAYDVILKRPDGTVVTVPQGFSLIEEPELDLEPGEIKMTVASHWGGPVVAADIQGDYAYLAQGRRLVILDISDESNPVEVGSLSKGLDWAVNSVKVLGDYALLNNRVVDVSDPTAPELVWAGNLGALVRGEYEYSTNYVMDVSDPLNPVVVGNWMTGSGDIIHGDYLFRATGNNFSSPHELHVFDLAADPQNPPVVASIEGGVSKRMAASGEHLYVVAPTAMNELNLVNTYDISDITSPVLVDSTQLPSGGHNVRSKNIMVGNGLLLVADDGSAGTGDLLIYDIATNPAQPELIVQHAWHGDRVDSVLHATDDRLYLANRAGGFLIKEITDPSQPQLIGRYHAPARLHHMGQVGETLFISDEVSGFHVLDVSDPVAPFVISTYVHQPYNDGQKVDITGLDIEGDRLYLGLNRGGLEVIDISDPKNPTFLAAFRPPLDNGCSSFDAIAVNNGLTHISYTERPGCGSQPIRFFLTVDVSDHTNMFIVNQLAHLSYNGHDVATFNNDDVAFVGRFGNATERYFGGITGPAPSLVGFVGGGDTKDMIWHEDILFVARRGNTSNPWFHGIYIRDVSDPANPVVLKHVDGQRYYALAFQNDRLYAQRDTSIELFDVSDPSDPLSMTTTVSQIGGGGVSRIIASEPCIYVSNTGGDPESYPWGFTILKVHGLDVTRECPPADLDCDGAVDVFDLLILLDNWGACADPGDCPGDLNRDGVVDIFDLLILLDDWGSR